MKFYYKTGLPTTAQLLPDFSRARTKTRQANTTAHLYFQTSVELRPNFGQIIQQDKPNTTAQLYSQTSVELGPKFGQIIQKDKPNTTAQLLQGSSGARANIWSNFTTRQAYLLQYSYSQTSVELGPNFGPIIKQDKPNATAQLLSDISRARTKIWSNYTPREA